MSIIKRIRPDKAGWRITVVTLLAVLLPIVNAAAQPGRAFPRIASGPTFRLAGKHVFTITNVRKTVVINWQVDREETPEGGGTSTIIKGIATAQGATAAFNLPKISGRETVYYIHAGGRGFSDTQRVQVFPPGARFSIMYKSRGNPDVQTYICVPPTLSSATKIVVVMAGQQRDADAYLDSWIEWASRNDYIALAPQFDEVHWPGSRGYMLGNVFKGEDGAGGETPESQWSFTVVEGIHQTVRNGFGISDKLYDLFGHSAGAQFVHRFLLFKPNASVRNAIAANAGWYTVPDRGIRFSYGLKHPLLPLTQRDLISWTDKNLIILRGTADVNSDHNLRVTPEANAQGKNRYERAAYMIEKARAVNAHTRWELIDVPGADHDQKKMAPTAQELFRKYSSKAGERGGMKSRARTTQ
jgi:hypothetical protein